MTEIKRQLMQGDPVADEIARGVSPIDAARMRRIVVAAAVERAPQPVAAFWPRPAVMAAALAACLLAGVTLGLRLDPDSRTPSPKSVAETGAPGARRQLQFVTTGGTRIIWTFHEHFEL
jgi:hypothetical protein